MSGKRISSGIQEVNIHGMSTYKAKVCLDSILKKADKGIYRIRVIHGFHSGTALKDMVHQEYRMHPKVLRIENGMNEGITELVLRELT